MAGVAAVPVGGLQQPAGVRDVGRAHAVVAGVGGASLVAVAGGAVACGDVADLVTLGPLADDDKEWLLAALQDLMTFMRQAATDGVAVFVTVR